MREDSRCRVLVDYNGVQIVSGTRRVDWLGQISLEDKGLQVRKAGGGILPRTLSKVFLVLGGTKVLVI